MIRPITVDDMLQMKDKVLIDVRSEAEFDEATIPGSINLPILNNDERAAVGKVYNDQGPIKARELGLKLVSPKLPDYVSKFQSFRDCDNLVVFCWRGGMRSKSTATLLDLMGFSVNWLQGGYKAYRRYINDFLANNPRQKIVVLHGLTGVGKTEIIKELRERGNAAIDLEGLAHNRGSVFGSIGMEKQPSQKKFDAELAEQLMKYRDAKFLAVECESKRIGRIILPDKLFQGMQSGYHLLLYDSLENRIDRLVKDYTSGTKDSISGLAKALHLLTKRLGKKTVARLESLLAQKDYRGFARILLTDYYDPLYDYPAGPEQSYDLSVCTSDIDQATNTIERYLESLTKEYK